ncbi:aminopeptidase [Massilia sp. W12]|uniref:aminopeptidase n=1 Tax=Massilia sp. W12 TaxID=3126507 RepID=UPI0030D50ABB
MNSILNSICKRALRAACALLPPLFLSGCGALQYYSQAAQGQLTLALSARPLQAVLDDPDSKPELRARLQLAQQIRHFSVSEIGLPDNQSFRRYVQLPRPYPLWNVVATPEFSLTPLHWCYPVAGCVSYRGYYDQQEGEAFAASLRSQGYDVHFYGVPAYSTLGWFADPLLSSFLHYPEAELARLMFHELAHQVLYVQNDSGMNESFATAVELAALERWLHCRRLPQLRQQWRVQRQRQLDYLALLQNTRTALQTAYAQPHDEAQKRAAKNRILARMQQQYQDLKHSWDGYAGYDRWFADLPGNAHLAAVATYHQQTPAWLQLLRETGSFPAFYQAARELTRQAPAERAQALQALQARAADVNDMPGFLSADCADPMAARQDSR